MSIDWTKEQENAIYHNGHDILVSAGAGSGKTAVLTERVLQYVLGGKDVDRMLILTFTRAAADQMKEKIRKKLREHKGEELSSEQRATQLNKIDSSYIMTFDAYALSVVKKYHYLLNVSREIGIIDANIISLKSQQILDEIMAEKYASHDLRFEKLISDFCNRDDEKIRKWVRELNKSLSTKPGRDRYLQEILDPAIWQKQRDELFGEYEQLLRERQDEIEKMLDELSTMGVENFDKVIEPISGLRNAHSYEQFHEYCDEKLGNLKKGSPPEASEYKKKIAAKISKLHSLTCLEKEDLLGQYDHCRDYLAELIDLTQQLKSRLDEYKKESDQYEYSDIFAMALQIIEEHEDVRQEISSHFFEIMIDEYQDTNDIQEDFISRIAHDNVYMVGDIKQSIYRFRNANPDIFQGRYEDLKNNRKKGEVIDLLSNFRSRRSVVDAINLIFNRLMDSRIGGADYRKDHQMVFAQRKYPEDGNDYKMEILNYAYDKQMPPFNGQPSFSRAEIEAFIIGQDIKHKIESGMQIFIPDKEIARNAEYRDFCILIDVSKQFDLFKKILTYLNIPVRIEQDEELKSSDVLTVIKNIFRLIKAVSEEDKDGICYNFVSVARSFVVEMTDSEIHQLIKEEKYLNTPLIETIRKISENLECKSIGELLEEIIREFEIDSKINRIGEVYDNQVRLEYLQALCHQLNKLDYDYVSFVEYLDHIFDDNNKIVFSMNKPDINAVRIQTIHKSKGLEYHICYFPGLYHQFNDLDKRKEVVYDNRYGIIVPDYIAGRGIKSTFVKELFKDKYDREDISEKIRLLYVALTRTMEKIVLVGPFEDKSTDGEVIPAFNRYEIRRMIDMLNLQYDTLRPYMRDIDLNDGSLGLSKDYNARKDNLLDQLEMNIKPLAIIPHSPVKAETRTSGKFSKGSGLITPEQKSSMAYGSLLHYYLEIIDLADPDYGAIEHKCQKDIRRFLNSELMKNIARGKAYKEYEFVFEEDGQIRHGFIDLLMEYDDHFDIIDYKLKHIDDEAYTMQLSGYRQYLQSITNKTVYCYLYSLKDGTFRKVE